MPEDLAVNWVKGFGGPIVKNLSQMIYLKKLMMLQLEQDILLIG